MMDQFSLKTEEHNEKTKDLDQLSLRQILTVMNEEDRHVITAVREAIPQIETAAEMMIETLRESGRIIYIGAGTSGRLGILDAVECGPTFGCTSEFSGLIAGGKDAVFQAAEGAEDRKDLAVSDLKNKHFARNDMLVGIAASGRTPYVIGAMEYAKQTGAKTACICGNFNTPIAALADCAIEFSAGPEILAGSTRLKSGTCQKLILNMLSTSVMIRMGRVYKNLMVDVRATNEKLRERCRRIVTEACGCDRETADRALKETGNDCKTAIVMILLDTDRETAEQRLSAAGGFVRDALKDS